MCGFIGNFGCNKNHIKDQFKKIVHRGPDNQSINSSDNWNIEFCRLSINDLSADGNQPFKVGKITSFVNGEIYNSDELKKKYFINVKFASKSDSEIIPYMYEKFGLEFIKYLDGMFTIVIVDGNKNKLYLIKDSFGKKPLYYKKNHECSCILFSSESRIDDEKSEIENQSFISLLFLHYKSFDKTIYKDINSIPPGSYLEYENNKFKIIKWYQPKIKKVNEKDIKENFLYLFNQSIKKRLMSDVKMGVFLSGGVDSNLIARSLYQNTGKKIITFSAIIQNKKEMEGNSTDTLDKIKSSLDGIPSENFFINIDYNYLNKNIVKIISEADQPIIDSAYIIGYACSEKAKEYNTKVIFTGIGADELFGGYSWQARYKNNNKIINSSINKISKLNKFFLNSSNRYVNYLFFPEFMHNTSLGAQYWKDPELEFLQITKKRTHNSISNYSKLHKEFFQNDYKNFLDYTNIYGVINHQVTYFDLSCMLNSIENRSPFLDTKLLEFCMGIQSKYKKNNKYLLKSIVKDMMPKEILERSKTGPSINYSIFFEDKIFLEFTRKFIFKNIYIIKKYISEKLANKIENSFGSLFLENYLPLISILKIIIWIKYNIEKSIHKELTFYELVKS